MSSIKVNVYKIKGGYDEESVIKSVFCSYRGVLYVHDVHGEKVDDLCGQMTLDKYKEIERRSRADITEFDGLEHYRCIVCDLEKKEKEKEQKILNGEIDIPEADWDNLHDPFAKPVTQRQSSSVSSPVSSVSGLPSQLPTNQYKVPTTPPANPEIGEFFFDVAAGVPKVWDGADWVAITPLGSASSMPSSIPSLVKPTQPIRFKKKHLEATAIGRSVTIQDTITGQTGTFNTPFDVDKKWLETLIDTELNK